MAESRILSWFDAVDDFFGLTYELFYMDLYLPFREILIERDQIVFIISKNEVQHNVYLE